MKPRLSLTLSLITLLLLAGCTSKVVWNERAATDGSRILIPCCPRCGQYVEYDQTECDGVSLRWTERPEEP